MPSSATASELSVHVHGLRGIPVWAAAVQRDPSLVRDVVGKDYGKQLEPDVRADMEGRLGSDFSAVRIHTDAKAAESAAVVSAKSYTVGNEVVFGHGSFDPDSPEGKHRLAHELTHVQQQRNGPVSGTDVGNGVAVSDPSDSFERDAEATASRALSGPRRVTGKGAGSDGKEGGRSAQPKASPLVPVQRFASTEHVAIGDVATNAPGPETGPEHTDIRYSEDPKDLLTFGEVVAMAGDYFGSLAEMERLSANPAGRRELFYARLKVTGAKESDLPDWPTTKKAVMNRYFSLAGRNLSHFAAGGGQDAYEQGHLDALKDAWISGQQGEETDKPGYFTSAVDQEAFCDHFLTDLFSAGHIRTPRGSIQEWYDSSGRFPPDRLTDWIKAYLVRRLNDLNPKALAEVPDWLIGWLVGALLDDMAGAALSSFSVGALVSMAMHDWDNEHGVRVVSACNQDGIQQEYHWRAYGDKQIGEGGAGKGAETFKMAVGAVRASRRELDQARELGLAAKEQQINPFDLERTAIAAVNVLMPFKALGYIPHEDTRPAEASDMSDVRLGDWHWGRFSPEMRTAFEASIRSELVNKVRQAADGLPEPYTKSVPIPPLLVSPLLSPSPAVLPKTIQVLSLHARQAVIDLSVQFNNAPLTTFEDLYGPASATP